MSSSSTHIIGPDVNLTATVKKIVDLSKDQATILDFSSGQLATPLNNKAEMEKEGIDLTGIEWIDGMSYADKYGEISRKKYIHWLAEQSNKPFFGGRSIKELFTYQKEVSLWWFTSMSTKHPVTHPLRWLFYMMIVLKREYDTDYSTWHLWVADQKTAEALENCLNDNAVIHIHPKKSKSKIRRVENIQAVQIPAIILRVLISVIKILCKVLQMKALSRDKKRDEAMEDNTVFIVNAFPRSWVENQHYNEKIIATDQYFGDFPWRLKEQGYEVKWMPRFYDVKGRKMWMSKRSERSLDDVADLMQFKYSHAWRLISANIKWLLYFLWYFEIKNKQRSFKFSDVCLGKWFLTEFRGVIISGWANLYQFHLYRSVIHKIQPCAVLYRDEFYISGKIVSASLKGKIKLIGIQHGLFGNEHTVYQFDEMDIQKEGEAKDLIHYCPVPDQFAVFGKKFKQLLEEWGGYPITSVKTVGGLRHDYILEKYGYLNNKEKRSLRKELGLPEQQIIILLCTGLYSMVYPWTNMVARALQKNDQNIFLAVKLHQYNGGESEVIRSLAKNNKFEYKIFADNIYSLVAAADIVIAGGSTVLLEANLIGTPAIALKAANKYTHFNFFDEKSFLHEASNSDEIRKKISLLKNQENIDGKRKTDYFNNPKIKAAKKIAELLPC